MPSLARLTLADALGRVGVRAAAAARDIHTVDARRHDWIAARGHSVTELEQRVGMRQPGFGRSPVGGIDRDAVRSGDVALFAQAEGPTAAAEHVGRLGASRADAARATRVRRP